VSICPGDAACPGPSRCAGLPWLLRAAGQGPQGECALALSQRSGLVFPDSFGNRTTGSRSPGITAVSLHWVIDRRSGGMVDCRLWASGAAYLLEIPAVQQRWTPEGERSS